MKKVLNLFIAFTIAITSITSCNSVEDIIDEPIQASEDVELAKLYNSIDSLQSEYLSSNITRVDWDKWGRRGLGFAVDGVVGLLFAETGPLAGPIGVVGSGLYEDYLDYMVSRCNTMNQRIQKTAQNGQTPIRAVVFPVENTTYVDSIGYYHNLIINEVKSNGKSYTDVSGNINYDAYYEDVLAIAQQHGILNDSHINTKLLFQYLESIIKPIVQLEMSNQEAVNADIILSIFFNSAYNGFNFDKTLTVQHQEICEKIIYNCGNIKDSQLVEYGTKVNNLIVNSNLDANTKDNLQIANNIAINSSLRWCE
jgi:hypothetical protein